MTASRLITLRIAAALLTLFLVSAAVFLMIDVLPGDVAQRILGREASTEALARLREQLQLNDPVVIRYFRWVLGMLKGDLGVSLSNRLPIAELVEPRLINTFFLTLGAIVIYLPLLTVV